MSGIWGISLQSAFSARFRFGEAGLSGLPSAHLPYLDIEVREGSGLGSFRTAIELICVR